MSEKFTSYYEWLAESNKLTLSQALVLSRVKQWGACGCWESYNTLAKKLKLDRRTVIRAVLFLVDKGLIKRTKDGNRRKILIFNYDNTYLPLFDSVTKSPAGKQVVSQSHQGSVTVPPYISYINNREETVKLLAELMRQPTAITKAEFQNRRNEQIKRLQVRP